MAFNLAAFLRHLFNLGQPTPPPTPPVTVHTVTVRVNDAAGVPVVGATVTLWWDEASLHVRQSDAFGRAFVDGVPDTANPAVRVEKDDYLTWQQGIGPTADVQVMFVSLVTPPALLVVAGRRLLLPNGMFWFGIGMDGFTTLQDLLTNRPKADALMAYMVAHKVEFLRVFGQYNGGIGRFIPAEHADYFDGLKTLATILRDKGKRLYFTTNADCQNAPLTFDPSFYDRVCDVLRPFSDSVLSDGGNEWPFNGFVPSRLRKPAGLISGAASVGGGYQPLHDPLWDFAAWQGGRDDDFERKYKDIRDQYMGDNTDPNDPNSPPAFAFAVPIIEDETIGLGDVFESGRTTNSPYKVWQYVAGAKIMGAAGVCLHQRSGIFGGLPVAGGLEEQCLDAGVAASQLPLGRNAFNEYQRGNSPNESQNPNLPVLHFDIEGPQGNPNGSLRTHAMINGNYAEVIAPGAGPGYVAQSANGWRIRTAYALPGHPANVLVCER